MLTSCKILNAIDSNIEVEFTTDTGEKITQTLSLSPIASEDENGDIVMFNPMDDLKSHLSSYFDAYQSGIEKEQVALAPKEIVGQTFTF